MGVGSFFRGDRLLLPAGFKMVWKTRAPEEEITRRTQTTPEFTQPTRGMIP
jgi:hypothetical protein